MTPWLVESQLLAFKVKAKRQPHTPAAPSQGKTTAPTGQETHSRPGRGGKEKNARPYREKNT